MWETRRVSKARLYVPRFTESTVDVLTQRVSSLKKTYLHTFTSLVKILTEMEVKEQSCELNTASGTFRLPHYVWFQWTIHDLESFELKMKVSWSPIWNTSFIHFRTKFILRLVNLPEFGTLRLWHIQSCILYVGGFQYANPFLTEWKTRRFLILSAQLFDLRATKCQSLSCILLPAESLM